jgi:hypothetical protein
VLAFDTGGTLLYGDQINWRNVTADRLVWGTLDPALGAMNSGTEWNQEF